MTSKCLSRCIKRPGVKLERSEETCLVKCQDAFLETWNTTSNAVNKLRQKIAQEMAGHHRQATDTPLD
jgi:import inner membrane translocase subunit TIM13